MGSVTAKAEIVLDISRLLSRIRHSTPTGVDRVEMAYARELSRRVPDRLAFGAVHPSGFYGRIPSSIAVRFLDDTERAWERGFHKDGQIMATHFRQLRDLYRMRPRTVPPSATRRVLIQSSPHHLHNENLLRAILKKENAAFTCLLHDLIPIEFPEYARPGGNDIHIQRMNTVARLADGIVANSESTRASFVRHAADIGSAAIEVAHIGLSQYRHTIAPRSQRVQRPYFVFLGTIEPRKNHLLLLHIWRRASEEFGSQSIPKLVIIGRRGWENEQIVDMLERCSALVGCVEEHSGIPDRDVGALVAGARALLLPSFAEGYGMPVPEALSLGVPVICSDIPALREAGGDVPLYLDPLDGPRWQKAIFAFTEENSAERRRQIERLGTWKAPNWQDHIDVVLDVADRAVMAGAPHIR